MGRGGGQAGWAKFPTFTENLFLGLPLSLVQRFFVHEHPNMNPIPLVCKELFEYRIVMSWCVIGLKYACDVISAGAGRR